MVVQNVTTNCDGPPADNDIGYVYEKVPITGKCCGKWEKTACIVGNVTYTVCNFNY